MKTVLLLACIVSASLLLPHQAVAAGPRAPGIEITLINGGGQLEGGTVFGVSALSYVVGTNVGNGGSLVLNGVATDCTIESVALDCSLATLLCEDVRHVVAPGVKGVSQGSLDGIAVVNDGFIRMFCRRPSTTLR